jgi:uncharacterized membrane protein
MIQEGAQSGESVCMLDIDVRNVAAANAAVASCSSLVALDQLQAMNETVANLKDSLDSFRKTNEDVSDFRKAGVLAIFAIALVFVFLGFVGVLSAFTPCKFDDYLEFLLHFTWVFGSFIGTLTFIVGGIALVASIGWSDMCQFMDLVKEVRERSKSNTSLS